MFGRSIGPRLKPEIIVYSAPRIAIDGNIVIESIRYMTNDRPRNRKRPSAKAASEPIASERMVTPPATSAELSSALRKNSAWKACLKLSSVGLLGTYCSGLENRSPSGVNAHRSAQAKGKSA